MNNVNDDILGMSRSGYMWGSNNEHARRKGGWFRVVVQRRVFPLQRAVNHSGPWNDWPKPLSQQIREAVKDNL